MRVVRPVAGIRLGSLGVSQPHGHRLAEPALESGGDLASHVPSQCSTLVAAALHKSFYAKSANADQGLVPGKPG